MSSDTLVPEMEGAVGEGITGVGVLEEAPGPVVRAPDFNHCYNNAESVNPLFDPRRVLLRRTFFTNKDAPNTSLLTTTQPATINHWWS